MRLLRFIMQSARHGLIGGRTYSLWMAILTLVVLSGVHAYWAQASYGLVVSGLSDQVPWGIYIANFSFLDGVAASAALVFILAYVFQRGEARAVAELGGALAVAASLGCILFVVVDLGSPHLFWHLIPGIGLLNWPRSMLAWDVIALNGYWVLNTVVLGWILYRRWQGGHVPRKFLVPAVYVLIFWAILIQAVIALLYAVNVGKPLWHTALMGPRFLASSFTAGAALMILAFSWISQKTEYKVQRGLVDLLALVVTVSLQANLFMLGIDLLTEFYHPTAHSASAQYMIAGLHGADALVPWNRASIVMQILAVIMLMVHPVRERVSLLTLACVMAIVGIWIEKGLGIIIPGFVPTPLGEIFEYSPSWIEIRVSLGIWALAAMVFSILTRAAISIETGNLREAPQAM